MNKIIFILFLVLSCNLSKKPSNDNEQSIIVLERTACFGKCPIYKIEIFANGNGIYHGKKFVKNIGTTNFKISALSLKKILTKAKKIEFNNMQKEYYEPISDLPTTYIRIYNKKIKDYIGAPKELKELEKLIDDIFFEAIKN